MNRADDHESFGEQVPGRIPESLIDAALDGEICDQMQEEIAHALRYDHARRDELVETANAVRALDLDDIPMPDMQCAVLNQLDQHDRFLPKAMRRWVRTGRMAIAAGILMGLMIVAGLQSIYPRLTTIGSQSTPVHDVASAVQQDAQRVAIDVQGRMNIARASISPFEGLLSSSSKLEQSKLFPLTMNHQIVRLTEADIAALAQSGVGQREVILRDGEVRHAVMVVSYGPGGIDNGVLLNTQHDGIALVGSSRVHRVEREKAEDEDLADLP